MADDNKMIRYPMIIKRHKVEMRETLVNERGEVRALIIVLGIT